MPVAAGTAVPHLAPHWDWDMCCWHSPSWWRRHWEKTGLVKVDVADLVPEGWEHWLRWETGVQPAWTGEEGHGGLLRADADAGLPPTPGIPRWLRKHAGGLGATEEREQLACPGALPQHWQEFAAALD